MTNEFGELVLSAGLLNRTVARCIEERLSLDIPEVTELVDRLDTACRIYRLIRAPKLEALEAQVEKLPESEHTLVDAFISVIDQHPSLTVWAVIGALEMAKASMIENLTRLNRKH